MGRYIFDNPVDAGSGTLGYKLEANPVNDAPNGSFSVYAHIAEYPHEISYSAIDSDTYDIAVKSSSAAARESQIMRKTACFTDYEMQCVDY